MAAASALVDPEMPEKNSIAIITTLPRPPRICPTSTRASVTSRCEMPPVSINSPARMKNGMASSEKLSMPPNTRLATIRSGAPS